MKYPIIGDGWTEVQALMTKECLVVRDFDAKGPKLFWRCIEVSSGKNFPLAVNRQPASDALYCSQSRELIFADQSARFNLQGEPLDSGGRREYAQTGLWIYHLQTSQETLLCSLDTDNFEILPLWASPDGEVTYFLQQKRQESLSDLIRRGPQGTVPQSKPRELQLFRLNRSKAAISPVTDVIRGIASYDIDEHAHSFFATSIDQGDTILSRIDLATSLVTVVGRFPHRIVSLDTGTEVKIESWSERRDVSLTRQGEILLTGGLGSGISRFTPPDTENEIVTNGHGPSFSPDGTRLAFLRRVGNGLWIKDGTAEPYSVYSFSRSGISKKPAWCFCGNHVVTSLISTDGEQKGITVVADVQRKELLTIEHSQHPYIPSGYIWIPETPRS